MARQSIILAANIEKRIPVQGHFLQVVDTGLASLVTVKLEWGHNQQDVTEYGNVSRRFKVGPTKKEFRALVLTSTVACTVDVLISDEDAGFDDGGGATVSIDPTQLPLSVAGTVTVSATADLACTHTYPGTVAVTSVGQQLLAADTSMKRVILYNEGPNSVYISRGALAAATVPAVVLVSGGTFIEDRFAGTNQAWRARCNATETASVRVEVTK